MRTRYGVGAALALAVLVAGGRSAAVDQHHDRPEAAADAEQGAGDGERADEHHGAHAAEAPAFRVADFERRGVQVMTAAAGTVDLGVELPGEIRANADRIAHLAPRFAGLVREVRKRIGDAVRAGEVLAVIESETLAPFELKAAFDGVVIDRHVVPGEAVSRDTPAFIVADLSTVWVDVHVYQGVLGDLHVDQPVRITGPTGTGEAEGRVAYIAPVVEQATRTATAWVVLPNPQGVWRPGLFVNVTVLTPVPAPVVVATEALHRFRDGEAVFVVAGDAFAVRKVITGRTGRTKVAIVDGLAPGERYAEKGSFLVKAELAKGAAGHEH
jgi:cobalt-zinc-cadmium efflux system membrane fusion protein